MTTDTTALQERIRAVMHEADPDIFPCEQSRAAAVLPVIAAEVRAAKAEALREAAGDIVWSAETLPHMTPHDAARGLARRADRIETEDQT